MKKLFKRSILLIFTGVILYTGVFIGKRLPIITGYSAKYLCSSVFVSNREAEDVLATDLGYSYFKHVAYHIDYEQKSVTATVLGMAEQKAIYREGTGATVLTSMSEEEFVNQNILIEKPLHNIDSLIWPHGEIIPETQIEQINYKKLNKAIENAFDDKGAYGKSTRAVLVLYDTLLVAEKYAEGFNQNTKLLGWSMTKSMINTMIGTLQRDGKLDINDPAPIPEWQKDERSKISINNLLHMSSGIEWEENYGAPSNVTLMLYGVPGMYEYSILQEAESAPNSVFEYKSGTSNILSGMIRNVLGDESYYNYPYQEIFHKIGMHNTVIETDASGNFVGSSYGYATARDWGRFGLLYLKDGNWFGDQILPQGWVEYTSSPAPASNNRYGAHFWINKSKFYPDAPEDMFSCNGHHGQKIMIIPSKNIVIVRLGFNAHQRFDFNTFITEILSAIEE